MCVWLLSSKYRIDEDDQYKPHYGCAGPVPLRKEVANGVVKLSDYVLFRHLQDNTSYLMKRITKRSSGECMVVQENKKQTGQAQRGQQYAGFTNQASFEPRTMSLRQVLWLNGKISHICIELLEKSSWTWLAVEI